MLLQKHVSLVSRLLVLSCQIEEHPGIYTHAHTHSRNWVFVPFAERPHIMLTSHHYEFVSKVPLCSIHFNLLCLRHDHVSAPLVYLPMYIRGYAFVRTYVLLSLCEAA